MLKRRDLLAVGEAVVDAIVQGLQTADIAIAESLSREG